MTPTRGTPERFCIRSLVHNRGEKFTFAFLNVVPAQVVTRIYAGYEITEEEMALVQKTLKERMTVT
jgi:hypothetical protein